MARCARELNKSIRLVRDTCPDPEFKAYRLITGRIMADLYLEVMQPIHRRFPDLEPEQLKRKASPTKRKSSR